MNLRLCQIGNPSLNQPYVLLKITLTLNRLLIKLVHYLSLLGVHSHPEILKHTRNLMFQTLIEFMNLSLLAIEPVLLHDHLLNPLTHLMQQSLKVIMYLRHALSNGLHIVTHVLSVDDTLRTDWRTVARETVIANELVGVVRARSTHRERGAAEGGHTSAISHVGVHSFLVVESACV